MSTEPSSATEAAVETEVAARDATQLRAPSWWRRAMSGLYEGVILFGVLYFTDYFFDTLTNSNHALKLRALRMAWLFLVLGVYFVWFWCHGGQTVPLKTWQMRVVARDGGPLSVWQAIRRYLIAWLVILPGPALISLVPAPVLAQALMDILVLLLLTLWMHVDPERANLVDRLAGTRLVDVSR